MNGIRKEGAYAMSEHQILRYLELLDRRLYIILHSGLDWKPEYETELEEIDKELVELRKVVDTAHKKGAVL